MPAMSDKVHVRKDHSKMTLPDRIAHAQRLQLQEIAVVNEINRLSDRHEAISDEFGDVLRTISTYMYELDEHGLIRMRE